MMMKNEAKVRITDQFRSGGGMVYDLKCDGIRITISMCSSEEIAGWKLEMLAKQSPNPPTVLATGPSRGEALGVLADAWQSRGGGMAYPVLDWRAIREALAAVKAI
jgi:hypothetical protein